MGRGEAGAWERHELCVLTDTSGEGVTATLPKTSSQVHLELRLQKFNLTLKMTQRQLKGFSCAHRLSLCLTPSTVSRVSVAVCFFVSACLVPAVCVCVSFSFVGVRAHVGEQTTGASMNRRRAHRVEGAAWLGAWWAPTLRVRQRAERDPPEGRRARPGVAWCCLEEARPGRRRAQAAPQRDSLGLPTVKWEKAMAEES